MTKKQLATALARNDDERGVLRTTGQSVDERVKVFMTRTKSQLVDAVSLRVDTGRMAQV